MLPVLYFILYLFIHFTFFSYSHRLRVYKALSTISSRFITLKNDQFEKIIRLTLEDIGKLLALDKTYLLIYDKKFLYYTFD